MDDQNKNLILATALSFLVILVWFVVFPPADPVTDPNAPVAVQGETLPPALAGVTGETAAIPAPETARLKLDTPRLTGSVALTGGRLDDLQLRDYRETTDDASDIVRLLRPMDGSNAFYALYGWAPGGSLTHDDVPGPNTPWQAVSGEVLAPGNPVTLEWANTKGQTFRRVFAVDENYMFTVTQSVENQSAEAIRLAPYSMISRHGIPTDYQSFFISHEGLLEVADGILTETDYSDLQDARTSDTEGVPMLSTDVKEGGWLGFGDKYWLTALIPSAGQAYTSVQKYFPARDVYQAEARLPAVTVEPGATASAESRLYAGAKEWATIRSYENDPGFLARLTGAEADPSQQKIERFVDSIDWGWFFFLTKPIFAVLHWLNGLIGNMGWAIVALTFILKALVLPLAYKSYVSMARMKELQPEMEALKERVGDDRQKLQQEMMKLYREKKVNPAAGCLPMLLQIPIFFSLYKVIFVTIELRHAPFFGVFQDLSMPDPTSIFNAFGFLPWAAPEPNSMLAMIFIGILPILLGCTMWLQQKLNPAPADPMQQQIFAWMPWIFMFVLGGFASGLVVYWITNNIITFIQQYVIMRSHGHKPDIFGNIKAARKRKSLREALAEKAAEAERAAEKKKK
ncbi:membrane protein insertase YidC [Falsigemmobacter intermedius]|uniref:Membrane protein insertase YidC n=1 Tax=Falsigemmobacter intermedius TaxID=1553448 RepID=A0A444MDK9_9RHOB|nr:membrane protein insertase YidC [Falsigemmobacter intermedius]RWY42489.1 membrane protein insertase YidC [Falsigemmobacter intermedius]